MCWWEIHCKDLPSSFEIHKVIKWWYAFSGAKQKWSYEAACSERKRKEKQLSQIGLGLQLFPHTLLQLARPFKKWPGTNDLEESFSWFSPRIHFLLSSWRSIQVHGCWFTLWPLTCALHSPSISHRQQIEVVLESRPQMCSYHCVHLFGKKILSLTTGRPCLSCLAIATEERNSQTVCGTDWVWQRPWALGSVAEKRWSMATATRLAILVNRAVKQLGGASGVLWMVPKSFLAFVNSVGIDSKCFLFLFLRYRSHNLVSDSVDTAWDCRLLTAYTGT